MFATPALAAVDGPVDEPRAPVVRRRAAGCTCREVVVNAENIVRDADVRSGDSKMTNSSITYVAPTFGDTEVEVDQDAEARSGHAIAGQILSVDAGEGCSRVHVRARNIVERSDVRSGDAIATNKSVVLLDPSINRGDLEIDIDQDAEAETGDAIAGQIIGVRGGGGPCGGVIVEALNRVRHVDVRSGEAITLNESDIAMCTSPGCIEDFEELLKGVDSIQVCAGDECEDVPVDEFVEVLKNNPSAMDDPETFDDDDDDGDEPDDDDGDDDDGDDPREEQMSEAAARRRAEMIRQREEALRRYDQYRQGNSTDTATQSDPEPDQS
jgi:hypothetical protein